MAALVFIAGAGVRARRALPPLQSIRDNGSNDEGWNREHVWPKSHGFPNEGDEPHTDGHHLAACDKWVNNRRSDKDFAEGGTAICLLPLDNPLSDCEVQGASTSSTFDVRRRPAPPGMGPAPPLPGKGGAAGFS